MNKRTVITWIIIIFSLLGIWSLIKWLSTPQAESHKSAWYYLDQVIELRKVKQIKVDEITELNKRIEEYQKLKDKLQYSWFSYMWDPFSLSWK